MQFGSDYIASHAEMSNHASQSQEQENKAMEQAEDEVLSQWDHEEELFADYSGHLKAPWERGKGVGRLLMGLLLLAGAGAAIASGGISGLGSLSGKGSSR